MNAFFPANWSNSESPWPLVYVDEVNGEILTRRYCFCRDGNQQDCEKSYLQELLQT
jgi:hypothetical protein